MKHRIFIAFAMALVSLCAMPAYTQAEIDVPVPQKKPDINKGLSVPVPVASDALASLPRRKPAGKQAAVAKVLKAKPSIERPPQRKASANPQSDYALYKAIFEAQSNGDMTQADRLIKQLDGEVLLGHVLYQRYMHPSAYKSSFEELKYWLDLYADHPGASKIYKMAKARQPSNYKGHLRKPAQFSGIAITHEQSVYQAKKYKSTKGRNASQRKSFISARSQLRKALRAGAPTRALGVLNTKKSLMDNTEYALFLAEISAGYFYAGLDEKAEKYAYKASGMAKEVVPLAHWIAGLVEWKGKSYQKAAGNFKNAAVSPYTSGWMQSAASFWAARALMRAGQAKDVNTWLRKAQQHPRTFYGLLAMRAMGSHPNFNWKIPTFTQAYFKRLSQDDRGTRAIALVGAAQPHLAEAELLSVNIKDDEDLKNALLAYANFANLPRLSMRLGNKFFASRDKKQLYDAAIYPKAPWKPSRGYQVDPAMLHAIIKQESRFNPVAKNSYSGARGLMQLMPATALYVAKKYRYPLRSKEDVGHPTVNMDLGQLYIQHLLVNPLVKGNTIKLLVAYNAGPGNLKRWFKNIDAKQDPLVFIEMIPVAETRAYVERVLSNYWMYRLREGQKTPTLDSLAQGRWGVYQEVVAPVAFDVASK